MSCRMEKKLNNTMFKYFIKKNYFLSPEIAHYYNNKNKDLILSEANKFYLFINKKEYIFSIKLKWYLFFFLKFRILRRLLRLDKSNVILNYYKNGVVILYQNFIYFYDLKKKKLKIIYPLKNCRNVLHDSIAVTKKGIFFGEYGSNQKRNEIPVWASFDDGRNWRIIYNFSGNTFRHIHGIYDDPFDNNLWITTGDLNNECYLFKVPKKNFNNIIKYGDGSQKWRAVSLMFKKKYIIWGMDSPLQNSHLQIFNRSTCKLKKGRAFPGPVWYSKVFFDHSAILQTSVEIGSGVKTCYSYLFYSKNLINWKKIYKFKKDFFPKKLFKFGVINFSAGKQSCNDFLLSAEGLKKVDGKVLSGRILY